MKEVYFLNCQTVPLSGYCVCYYKLCHTTLCSLEAYMCVMAVREPTHEQRVDFESKPSSLFSQQTLWLHICSPHDSNTLNVFVVGGQIYLQRSQLFWCGFKLRLFHIKYKHIMENTRAHSNKQKGCGMEIPTSRRLTWSSRKASMFVRMNRSHVWLS